MSSSEWIAALPMYDFPELGAGHDALWSALAARLDAAGIDHVPRALTRGIGHYEVWGHPRLLLAQACEYPLSKSFVGRVRVVATPSYTAPGCGLATYRSAIVVRDDDRAQTLADLRHRRCAVNEAQSNSGMNLLRAAVAPLAQGAPFFDSVTSSGSHRHSAQMVADGRADVAAIDCVTFAHLRQLYPDSMATLRILDWTQSTPALPFITGAHAGDALLDALRRALDDVLRDERLAPLRARLFLQGMKIPDNDDFAAVTALERGAAGLGYPTLV